MNATAIYAAKRELIDRLDRASQQVGGPLDGVQVSYMRPGSIGERAIYGGSGRSAYADADAEAQLVRETVTVGLYVRTLSLGDDVRAAEAEVEALAKAAVTLLADDRELTGELSFAGLLASIADVYPHYEQIECILGMSVRLESWLVP